MSTLAEPRQRPRSSPSGISVAGRRFSWRGIEFDGRRRRGTVVALDAAEARAVLQRRGVIVLTLMQIGKAAPPKASQRQVTVFTRHLASLLRAGLPLTQALELIGESSLKSGMPRIALALARGISDGAAFATALAHFPAQFDALYCQLAALGESTGSLDAALARIADERQRTAELHAKARAALAYPCAVLLFAAAVTAALLIWVVPAFEQVFENFGAALPGPTRVVIALSHSALVSAGPVLALGTLGSLIIAWLLRRSPTARLTSHRIALTAPLAGPVLRSIAAARFVRALGTLLAAGTPLTDALGALTHATGNAVFDRASVDIAARLTRGERLAAAMRAVGCFAPAIVQPIAIAEESGALDAMLLDIASLAEREARDKLAFFASLAEPCVVIVLGALIGCLVVALYLPVIELGNVV
jgi:type IV pilus assembly protein PilC